MPITPTQFDQLLAALRKQRGEDAAPHRLRSVDLEAALTDAGVAVQARPGAPLDYAAARESLDAYGQMFGRRDLAATAVIAAYGRLIDNWAAAGSGWSDVVDDAHGVVNRSAYHVAHLGRLVFDSLRGRLPDPAVGVDLDRPDDWIDRSYRDSNAMRDAARLWLDLLLSAVIREGGPPPAD